MITPPDDVELVSVGIDIGTSTSHLVFSRLHLQRLAQELSSRFVVIRRDVLHRSTIRLTPYRPDNSIDAPALQRFLDEAYHRAGVAPDMVDSGAVILTGEALKRPNARALAGLLAGESGRFICVCAGHHLEAALAAHGSGAVALSEALAGRVLNMDVGGGTSKFALADRGVLVGTAAVAVGGRLVVRQGRRVVRVEEPARQAARRLGISLSPGMELSCADEHRLVGAFVEVLLTLAHGAAPSGLTAELLLTEALELSVPPDVVTFSGGVAEYLYGRETRSFDDLAPRLAAQLRVAIRAGQLPGRSHELGEGIRATVIGASQFTTEVSGNTIALYGQHLLPLTNVPVLRAPIDLSTDPTAHTVSAAIRTAARRLDAMDPTAPVAVAFRWAAEPSHRRLAALAGGLVDALTEVGPARPLVVAIDGDVARSLGRLLVEEWGFDRPLLCLDGLALREFDYIDIGTVIRPSNVVPVIVKSLLFSPPEGEPSPVKRTGPAARRR
jgi:ethanolamine utilization protein EutA